MTKIVLKNVRASYVTVFKPRGVNGGEPKYSVQLIIPKNHPQITILKTVILDAAKEKWASKMKGADFPKWLKNPLRDGDIEEDKMDLSEYQNKYFVNCTSKNAPVVVDKNPKIELTESDKKIYSGCYVNASINFYAFDVSGNKGVAVGLNAVQFHAEGEALGGGYVDATKEFDDESDEELDLSDDEIAG